MGNLILVRHGISLWNIATLFTGWTDIDLAPEGLEEAKKAGELLKKNNFTVDICFSSYLKRAIRTAWIILDNAEMMQVDCLKSWKLNERNYGAWQGLNKNEMIKTIGEDHYLAVSRGYDTPPPPLALTDKRHPQFDPKYKDINTSLLPATESLKDTEKRVVEYYYEAIVPQLVQNKTVLVAAHGNSLRALIKHIETISIQDIPKLEIATGVPIIYVFSENMELQNHYILKS